MAWEIILAIIGSGGLFAFIQYLLTRHDNKSSIISDIKESINKLHSRMDKLDDKIDEGRAIQARVRILRFSDELRQNIRHSKDYFDQVLTDIDTYESYCNKHEEFANSITIASCDTIKECYKKQLETNDFL